jgi:hypothetical protein
VILGGIAISEEAKTFVALNEQRQRLSQADIFFGMLAAGEADAKLVQDMIAETGWTIRRQSNVASYGPGELQCAPMLVRQLREKSADAVRFGLTTLRAAYPDQPVRQAATLLNALGFLFVNLLEEQDSAAAIIASLAKADPDGWILRGKIFRERYPVLSGPAALARVIIDQARGKVGATGAALPPSSRAAPVVTTPPLASAPARAASPAAIAALARSGKAFCDQCDRMCTHAEVNACRDSHCKLKA